MLSSQSPRPTSEMQPNSHPLATEQKKNHGRAWRIKLTDIWAFFPLPQAGQKWETAKSQVNDYLENRMKLSFDFENVK